VRSSTGRGGKLAGDTVTLTVGKIELLYPALSPSDPTQPVYDIASIFSLFDLNAIPKTVLIRNAANAMKQAMRRKTRTITAITWLSYVRTNQLPVQKISEIYQTTTEKGITKDNASGGNTLLALIPI